MAYSKMTDFVQFSPNHGTREHKITHIVVHHAACVCKIEDLGREFAKPERQASANYGVGSDGRIGCYLDEIYEPWTSSNRDIDDKAVTIEVCNSTGAPNWEISAKAYTALVNLIVDICKRNGITKLTYTGDKTGNLHMHKWYAATACPGPYLEKLFPQIAADVNKKIAPEPAKIYRVQVGAFSVKSNAEAMLKQLKAKGFDGFIV